MNRHMVETMMCSALLASFATGPVLGVGTFDWPCYRGPQRNGVSAETVWSPASLGKQAKVLWKAEVGDGHGCVAIKDGKLCIMGNKGGSDTVFCLDPATGKELWKYSYPCAPGVQPGPGPRSTATMDGTHVYTVSYFGDVYCLDAKTGKPVWNRNVMKDLGGTMPQWGVGSSAYLVGTMVLVNSLSYGVALDKDSGKVIWQSPGDACGYATPVVFKKGTVDCAAMFGKDAMHAVELKTGKLLWSVPWKTSYDVNAADPIIMGDTMYVSSGYETGAALLDITGDAPRDIWRNKDIRNQFSTCVVIGNRLYGIHGNTGSGKLVCVDPKTGRKDWEQAGIFESLTATGDRLITMNAKGEIVIVEATPSSYRELGRAEVLPVKNAKMWTAPVLCNGRIYCRNSLGNLVCLDVSK